jgi:hypothetical protein
MIAETGAKNGVACPRISVAISHASAAETEAWKIDRQATRSRSRRARIDTRDLSAASSNRGAARSASVGGCWERRGTTTPPILAR